MNKSDYLADILSVRLCFTAHLTIKASFWGLDTVSMSHFEALNGNIGIKTSKWGFDSPRASKSSKWGLAVAVSFIPSFWGHEVRNQSDILSLWCKAGFCGMNLPSTIYPKSRFCTKRHKRLYFQGFWSAFEAFARKAEKGNCKFEPQKCNSVFEGGSSSRRVSFFFDYRDALLGVWEKAVNIYAHRSFEWHCQIPYTNHK